MRTLLAALLILQAPASPPPIRDPATATEAADRLNPPPPPIVGLHGLPVAPYWFTDCEQAHFYREQAGLPGRFDAIIWRESNCRNEDAVRTFCCHSMYQLYVSLHLRDHRLIDRYHACDIYSADDLNSDTPIEKQRASCAAKAVFDVVGYSAWSTA